MSDPTQFTGYSIAASRDPQAMATQVQNMLDSGNATLIGTPTMTEDGLILQAVGFVAGSPK